MASGITISDYALVLGKTADPVIATRLRAANLPDKQAEWHGQVLDAEFLSELPLTLPLHQRLVQLLQLAMQQLPQPLQNEAVMLVLPHFAGPDNQQLTALLSKIMQQYPQLLTNEQCRVFPYGRSGGLMAVAAAQQLLNCQAMPVWLIAIDSYASAEGLTPYLQRNNNQTDESKDAIAVPSEAAIILKLEAESAGLYSHFYATDATPGSAEEEHALMSMFGLVADKLTQPLKHLYLGDGGSAQLMERWLSQYNQLSGVVNTDTAFEFPAYQTGELGAAGSLYRLLHLYQGYQQGRLSGLTLQCELSDSLYRAATVFSYTEAGSS